jgi:hypothetical protein
MSMSARKGKREEEIAFVKVQPKIIAGGTGRFSIPKAVVERLGLKGGERVKVKIAPGRVIYEILGND